MLPKALGGHGETESLAVLSYLWLALLPTQELIAVISELLRAAKPGTLFAL